VKVGDLVRCVEGACTSVDGGVGIVIQVEKYDPNQLSIHVQWQNESLWYHGEDLEVISENR
tara:strand:- start:1724 stop:1906 length:183 start_codon:yes stop_codon:yes gene_type:complete